MGLEGFYLGMDVMEQAPSISWGWLQIEMGPWVHGVNKEVEGGNERNYVIWVRYDRYFAYFLFEIGQMLALRVKG